MKQILYKDKLTISGNKPWLYTLGEKTDSDKLLYEIVYNLTDKGKIIRAELNGEGATTSVIINLDVSEGVKKGFFVSNKTFANIFFKVERLTLFCDTAISFELSLFS